MYCVKCGSELMENVLFCHVCGNRINAAEAELTVVSEDLEVGNNNQKSNDKYKGCYQALVDIKFAE